MWIALPVVHRAGLRIRARDTRDGPAVPNPSASSGCAAAVSSVIGTRFVRCSNGTSRRSTRFGAVWTGTAAAATAFGAWRGGVVFRWQGTSLAALATLLPLARTRARPGGFAARMRRHDLPCHRLPVRRRVRRPHGIAETRSRSSRSWQRLRGLPRNALQALFVWRVVPTDLVAPVWAVSAAALVVMGAPS